MSKTAVELSVTTDYKYNTGGRTVPLGAYRAVHCACLEGHIGGCPGGTACDRCEVAPWRRAVDAAAWLFGRALHCTWPWGLQPILPPPCLRAGSDDEGEEVDAATSMANEMDL